MAKLPDGWIFIPRIKDNFTIEVEKRELVTCQHCEWYDNEISICDNCGLPRERNFFCSDGIPRKKVRMNELSKSD